MPTLIKNKLSQVEIEAMPYLLKNDSLFLVSAGVISFTDYVNYLINSINYFLRQNKNNYSVIIKEKKILGMALLRFLKWDSNFFKMPVGCIEYLLVDRKQKEEKIGEIEKKLLNKCIHLAKKVGIKLLYISSDSQGYSLISALNCLSFEFICGELEGVGTRKGIAYLDNKQKRLEDEYEFRSYRKNDYPQIINIAREIAQGVNSKFSLNSHLPQIQKSNYYLESIKNCCLGINADKVFVAVKRKVVVGFICYRDDRIFEKSSGRKMSFLVMGGVLGSEHRKKVGTYFFSWAHKQILKKSEIILGKVYLHNLPMMRFILGRRFMHSFGVLYTFCKKL